MHSRRPVSVVSGLAFAFKDEEALVGQLQPDANPWDEFIKWARRFYEASDFEKWERDYKIVIGSNLIQARDALFAGADEWVDLLDKAFGPPNNLTNWRFNQPFKQWYRLDQDQAGSALRVLWDTALSASDRIDGFVALLPSEAPRVPLAAVSFLHMAVDPCQYPIFRPMFIEKALSLTGFPRFQVSRRSDKGAVYERVLTFFDKVIEEAEVRGLHLRDRLDVQGIIWRIATTKYSPPSDWPEADQRAFRAFRGDKETTDDRGLDPI